MNEAPTTTQAEQTDEQPISAKLMMEDAQAYGSQAQTLAIRARNCAKDTKFLAERYMAAARSLNDLANACQRRAGTLEKKAA